MSYSIDLIDIWNLIKKRWAAIVLIALVAGILAGVYTNFFITKKYSSHITFYVSNAADSKTGNVSGQDMEASTRLTETYIVLLKEIEIREKVSRQMTTELSAGAIGGYISIDAVGDTEVLKITAQTPDPELSAEICNAYAVVAPEVLTTVVKAGSVEILGPATPSTNPSYPNVQRNALLGAFIGAVASFALFFLLYLLDSTVKSSEDIEKRLNIPVLGEIPSFDDTVNKK